MGASGINSRARRLSTSPRTVWLVRAEEKDPLDKLVTAVLVKDHCQAIEKRYAVDFASSPPECVGELVQLYAIGNDICAITEYSVGVWRGYKAMIYVRDVDTWKIRMAYSN